jgi:hypothetical protein
MAPHCARSYRALVCVPNYSDAPRYAYSMVFGLPRRASREVREFDYTNLYEWRRGATRFARLINGKRTEDP